MASGSSAPVMASSARKYDVFLSFCTRNSFTDHLYQELNGRGFITFRDNKGINKGEQLQAELKNAIEESTASIVVLSKNYATSTWCLDELLHILEQRRDCDHLVVPVFYGVEPSDVRNLKGDFDIQVKPFSKWTDDKVSKWKAALMQVADLAGHVLSGHESEHINKIVDTISDMLDVSYQNFGEEDLVGMKARLRDLESLLNIRSGGVEMVGVWGMVGSGKTTLAYSLLNKIFHQFQGHCILENIRERSRKKKGLKSLQEKMLSALLKREVKVHNVIEGKHMMKSMFCDKKVLVILDDVDDLDQLEMLAEKHNWFGSGSRIIITTRDKHLLTAHKVANIYEVNLLSDVEAMQLFKRHAYNDKDPIEDFETLSSHVISYAAGSPIALVALGSLLHDQSSSEWNHTLAALNSVPDPNFIDILKISYDGLTTMEKELFLDIACFFKGRNIDDVIDILEAFGYHTTVGIEVLKQKALISIVDGMFYMRSLIQDTGRHIVRGIHPYRPEKHSRVWYNKEIDNIDYWNETMTKENHKIEAISYKGDSPHFCTILSNMKKLRYVDWEGCPASPLPDTFQPVRLAALKLEDSLQIEVWKGLKCLPHLKLLQLKYMKKLLTTPNFDGLPCLEKLTLSHCYKLKDIHQSLGKHTSLKYISVSRCAKLSMFPTVVHMEKLKTLEIEACPKIVEFPEIQANMESLVKLSLKWIGIEVLPSSIEDRCTNLTCLHLSYLKNLKCIEFSFDALKQLEEFRLEGLNHLDMTRRQLFETLFNQFPGGLQELNLSACCLEDGEIPSCIAHLSNLKELDLRSNDFSQIFSLSQLTRLKRLDMSGCDQLLELPELPSSLAVLSADSCKSLTTFGDCLKNCEWLCQVSVMGGTPIDDGRRLLQSMLEGKVIENGSMLLQLKDAEIPKGFRPPLLTQSRCTLQLPQNWCNEFSGFLICAVFTNDFDWKGDSVTISVNSQHDVLSEEINSDMSMGPITSSMDSQHDVLWEESDSDMRTWVGYVSFALLKHTKWWDEAYNTVSFKHEDKYGDCSGFGVRLVAKKSGSGLMETSTSLSNYAPKLNIESDSYTGLTISLTAYDGGNSL